MADKPLDSSANQPLPPKPDASSHSRDSAKERQARAQQTADAKLHEAADSRPPAPKTNSSNPQPLPGLQALTDFAGHALQPLQKLRTDAVLAATHMNTDDIAKQLPSDLVKDLAQGRAWQTQNLGNAATPDQKRQIAVYEQYKTKYLNDGLASNGLAAAALDRNTVLDELNQSIAKRFKSEHPDQSAAIARQPVPGTDSTAPTSKTEALSVSQTASGHDKGLPLGQDRRQEAAQTVDLARGAAQLPEAAQRSTKQGSSDTHLGQLAHLAAAETHPDTITRPQRNSSLPGLDTAISDKQRSVTQQTGAEANSLTQQLHSANHQWH